jgi:hypothetical protein
MWLACESERASYIDALSQCNKNNIQIWVENLGSKNIILNKIPTKQKRIKELTDKTRVELHFINSILNQN